MATGRLIVGAALGALVTALTAAPAHGQGVACDTPRKIVIVMDNSGSVSTSEFDDFQTAVFQLIMAVLGDPGVTNTEIGVIQYISSDAAAHQYDVTVPFSTSVATLTGWSRSFGPGGTINSDRQDHLPGSLREARVDGVWNAGGALDLTTTEDIEFILFTDAAAETTTFCCSFLTNTAFAPNALADFGEYNFLKTNFSARFTVAHVLPAGGFGVVAERTGAAIASVGDPYTGTVTANAGDPEGSGTTPRQHFTPSFNLSQADLDGILNAIAGRCGRVRVDDTALADVRLAACNPYTISGTCAEAGDPISVQFRDDTGTASAATATTCQNDLTFSATVNACGLSAGIGQAEASLTQGGNSFSDSENACVGVTAAGNAVAVAANNGVNNAANALGAADGGLTGPISNGDSLVIDLGEQVPGLGALAIAITRSNTTGRVTIDTSTDGVTFANPMDYGDGVGTPAAVGTIETVSYALSDFVRYVRFRRTAGGVQLDAVAFEGCGLECTGNAGCGAAEYCGQARYCLPFPDSDLDGVIDPIDVDDDQDGIPDTVESPGFPGDPGADSDDDGVFDWQDPSVVPGGCPDTAAPAGVCDSLPVVLDRDGDVRPNHLDRDADGDGITDVRETSGVGRDDVDGDGVPDACGAPTLTGACSAGGLVGAPLDTDMALPGGDMLPDYQDPDSDADGLLDTTEAFDASGDGVVAGGETLPTGVDSDSDGIDDAFDPDVVGSDPITSPLAAFRDADNDGTPDWLEVCGDRYLTGTEPCDTGGASATCSARCLLELGQLCGMSGQCESMACIGLVCSQPTIDLEDPDAAGPVVEESITPRGTALGLPPGTTVTVMVSTVTGGMSVGSCTGTVDVASAFQCDAPITGLLGSTSYRATAAATFMSVLVSDTEGFVTAPCVGLVQGDACDGGFCDGAGGGASCVPCVDTMTGAGPDAGCSAGTPLCVDLAGTPTCVTCTDDTTGGADLGCGAGAPGPVCDASTPASAVCTACEDNNAGMTADNGCAAPAAFCLAADAAGPSCVECIENSQCPVMGTVCGAANTCVPGCDETSDCAGTETPVCDVANETCVGCLADSDCSGVQSCDLGSNVCRFPDTDQDGVTDNIDLDDDNDGILDSDELGGDDLSEDTDGDDVPDFLDPDAVTCTDSEPDGICDAVPASVDFDGDGIANHLDLDADGDGLADLVEGGGNDTDGDGLVDGFTDGNGDGLDDAVAADPLPIPNTDGTAGPDFLDLDSDDDGLTDTLEAGGADADGNGQPDGSPVDGNGDGIADVLTGVNALPTPDTDADGTPDYQDVDSDGDGIPDTDEAFDGNGNGVPDVVPAGTDADGDGLDDAFDGVPPAEPNTDSEGAPNWRDVDSDGDGITDSVECPAPASCADSNRDGAPDYLSLDADGDTLPDATEGHDVDHDGVPDVTAAGADTDGDGLDDAFDADCADAVDCGGVIGVVAPTPDLDTDGVPDFQDPEDDGDGIATATEVDDAANYTGPAADGADVDGDDLRNWYDTDSDGDTAPDAVEDSRPDLDGDLDDNGILDYLDPGFAPTDTDNDGILDAVECPGVTPVGPTCQDSDGDGAPDFNDVDDDNDGVLTLDEYAAPDPEDGDPASDRDADNDGVPNHLDLDADNDGIPDIRENGTASLDADGDGRVDAPADLDGDGLDAAFDADDGDASNTMTGMPLNTDMVGPPDYLDLDADDDGIRDIVEADGEDTNGDGVVDGASDADGDGLADRVDPDNTFGSPWPTPDTDSDGAFDFQDVDADNDTVPDSTEGHDVDANGTSDVTPSGSDLNLDGVDDAYTAAAALPDRDLDNTPDWRDVDDDGDGVATALEDVDGDGDPTNDDTDSDGTPNYLDPDDDGDTVPTRFENPDPDENGAVDDAQDTDSDGTPDYLDADDDEDGVPTRDESPDPNGDGDPSDALDTDGDGIPDYLDATDGGTTGGVSGGALCAADAGRNGASGLAWLLGFLGIALSRRRRRSNG